MDLIRGIVKAVSTIVTSLNEQKVLMKGNNHITNVVAISLVKDSNIGNFLKSIYVILGTNEAVTMQLKRLWKLKIIRSLKTCRPLDTEKFFQKDYY
jgi:hypothetical protein